MSESPLHHPRRAPGDPVDATVVPRYAGDATFARLAWPTCPTRTPSSGASPSTAGVSYRPGARFGPTHIRQSSRLLRPAIPGP
jgi:agmatinase